MRSYIVDGKLKPRREIDAFRLIHFFLSILLAFGAVFFLTKFAADYALGLEIRVPPEYEHSSLPETRMVGRWISDDGKRILISSSGAIWADTGHLLGKGAFEVEGDVITLFYTGPKFRCNYSVRFEEGMTDWTVTDRTAGTPCPAGKFSKPFVF